MCTALLALLMALSAVSSVSAQQTLCQTQPGTCQNDGICFMISGVSCCQCPPDFSGVNCANADSNAVICQVCPTVSQSACACEGGSFQDVQSCPEETTTTEMAPPTTTPIPNDGCLHIDTLVRAGGGGEVRVRDVKVGDSVLAWDSHLQVVRESKVLAFIHHQPQLEVEMVQVRVAGRPTPLSLTPSHLIYTCQSGSTPCTNIKFASEVKEGDVVGLVTGHTGQVSGERVVSGQVSGERVVSVHRKVMRGISSPLTDLGTIVANDVVVSCYSTFPYPRVMHTLVTIGTVVGKVVDMNLVNTRAALTIIDIAETFLLRTNVLS